MAIVANTLLVSLTRPRQVQGVRNGIHPSDDVESLRSQGMVVLHEMFHTKANSIGVGLTCYEALVAAG
jgi:hypothetical protein